MHVSSFHTHTRTHTLNTYFGLATDSGVLNLILANVWEISCPAAFPAECEKVHKVEERNVCYLTAQHFFSDFQTALLSSAPL